MSGTPVLEEEEPLATSKALNMSISMEVEIYNKINSFREDPESVIDDLNLLKNSIQEQNPKDTIIDVIDYYIPKIKTLPKIKKISLNAELSKYAQKELKNFIKTPKNYIKVKKAKECKDLVPKSYADENPSIIYYSSHGKIANLLPKLLINTHNTYIRKILCDNNYTQIGIAHAEEQEYTMIVLIFAQALPKVEEEEIPKKDLDELKEIFDLFDFQNQGKFIVSDALRAMEESKFDQTEPTLYSIIKELGTEKNVLEWNEFSHDLYYRLNDRSTKESLTELYQIFKDDLRKGSIDLDALKKMCNRLGIKKSKAELNELLSNATNHKNEITFELFCELLD